MLTQRDGKGTGWRGNPPPGFAVIPAVDVIGSQAVRLRQGDFTRLSARAGDAGDLVARFARRRPPYIHVVDLDGARSRHIRPELVRRLSRLAHPVPLQVGGGVRSPDDGRELLDAGARRVVVGTAAFARPDALSELAAALGRDLVVALDVRAGVIRVEGWTRSGGVRIDDAVARCRAAGVARLLCTAIARDGTMGGPDLRLLRRVAAASAIPVLAAGGVRHDGDLLSLAEAGLEGAVVGRALLA